LDTQHAKKKESKQPGKKGKPPTQNLENDTEELKKGGNKQNTRKRPWKNQGETTQDPE
jgi:hypothetical protein